MLYLAILNGDSGNPSGHWASRYLYVLKSMIWFTNIRMNSDIGIFQKSIPFLVENKPIQDRLYYLDNLFPILFNLII